MLDGSEALQSVHTVASIVSRKLSFMNLRATFLKILSAHRLNNVELNGSPLSPKF